MEKKTTEHKASGYGSGSANTLISAGEVLKQAEKLAEKNRPTLAKLRAMTHAHSPKNTDAAKSDSDTQAFLEMQAIVSGYGRMQVLHSLDLCIGKGMALCLIGPNGSGKSTVLNTLFSMTRLFSGKIFINQQDISRLQSNQMLSKAGISYLLQDNSIFPNMTVEENLFMGGFLKPNTHDAHKAAEEILLKYDRLRARRNKKAGVLSGGERRLLEISRSLIMNPDVLLIDEPSIGLEPRFIDMIFEIISDLKNSQGKTIVMVEQNAKKGLAFADIGYVLVSGHVVMAGKASELLEDPQVGRLFLGG